ncbi:helix-turn-helix transcriptional regulator [Taklimakanibacter lacteus]|uniref:helix-turn-helix transcriptional regulator n=1 Tax=Taklimakanibacter lacteus TaxID=2268456 RepID=UPI000E66C728
MRKVTSLDDKLNRKLPEVMERLLDEDRLIGGLIEDYDATGERTVVAATFSGFVTPEFQQRYLEKPWPCLTNWLLMRCLEGETDIFLDRATQAQGNLGRGLDLVMLDYIQTPMDFTSAEGRRIMTVFFPFFLSIHRGYNLNSMFVEAGSVYEQMALSAGFRLYKSLDLERDPPSEPVPPSALKTRGVYYFQREMVADTPPSTPVSAVFTYLPPRFRFTAGEQRMLLRAIDGLTDEEIAGTLDVSRDAVKQTWRSIYDHVIQVMPDLVERGQVGASAEGGRGQEKRRRIVAYVRDNAQELRPHYLRRG